MTRIYRKRNSKGIRLLLLSSIIILNFVGISYSYWENGLDVSTRVSTGNLGVIFDENLVVGENLTFRFEDHNRVMIIEGTVDMPVAASDETAIAGSEYQHYEGSIQFGIVNNGTVPVKLTEKNIIKGDIFSFDEPLFSEELSPGEDALSNLEIKAGEGTYDFEIELQYSN